MFTWDGTINVGHIIAIGGVLSMVIAFAFTVKQDIRELKRTSRLIARAVVKMSGDESLLDELPGVNGYHKP